MALRDAAQTIADSPTALQLRYLQTLQTISAERNSTIVFPFPVDLISFLTDRGRGGGGGGRQHFHHLHQQQQQDGSERVQVLFTQFLRFNVSIFAGIRHVGPTKAGRIRATWLIKRCAAAAAIYLLTSAD